MDCCTIDAAKPNGKGISCYSTVDDDSVLLTLRVPNRLLLNWLDVSATQASGTSYIGLLNKSIPQHAVRIKTDCKRIEDRLRTAARKVRMQLRQRSHRRSSIIDGEHCLYVREEETEDLEEIAGESEDASAEARRWQEIVEKKEREITALFEGMGKEIEAQSKELREREKELATLKESSAYTNRGRPIAELGLRQTRRKLAEVATLTTRALWFADTFGLVPESLKMRKAGSGERVTMQLDSYQATAPPVEEASLPSGTDKQRIVQVLYLLDRFALSDEAYHELSSITSDLPPSYQVKRRRKEMNESTEVVRLTGSTPGAYRPLVKLLQLKISERVSFNKEHTIKNIINRILLL